MAKKKPGRRKIALPEIEGEARAVVAEAFMRLAEDAGAAIQTAKQAVRISDVPMTIRQLAYWRNVLRALKWAHWRMLRCKLGSRVDEQRPAPKPR